MSEMEFHISFVRTMIFLRDLSRPDVVAHVRNLAPKCARKRESSGNMFGWVIQPSVTGTGWQ